jgi:hypothetical protein
LGVAVLVTQQEVAELLVLILNSALLPLSKAVAAAAVAADLLFQQAVMAVQEAVRRARAANQTLAEQQLVVREVQAARQKIPSLVMVQAVAAVLAVLELQALQATQALAVLAQVQRLLVALQLESVKFLAAVIIFQVAVVVVVLLKALRLPLAVSVVEVLADKPQA